MRFKLLRSAELQEVIAEKIKMGLRHATATFAVLLIVGAIKEVASAGAQLTISTSPSGPVYPAASWVRVACRHNHSQPHLLQYRWTGSCNSTSAAVFDIDDPLLDEQGWAVIWVKTTPVNCLDHFRCTVQERNGALLTEIASEVFIFQHISGVGISLPDDIFLGSIPNNSAVVLQEGTHQEVICHSARRSSCVSGQWTSTADTEITIGNCDHQTAAAEVTFDSVRLDLSTVSEQGVHSCVVNDERGIEQKLFIGIYQSVPTLILEQRYHITTDGLVALECDTTGLPSTATLWSRDGALLDVLAADTRVLSDYQSTLYRNTLALLSEDTVGVISCDVYSDWVTSDKRNWGRQSANGFFVIAPLSESVSLECAFPEGTTNVEWLNDLTPLQSISTARNNTALISLRLTEDVHGQTYVCTGRDGQGRQLQKHYMILAQVPDDILSMRIKYPQTEPTAHQPLHLQCCASHTSQGISSQPALQWYKDGRLLTGTKTSSVGERERCLTIEFTSLQDRDEGEYTCRATLQSSRMEELLVKEESFELSLEWLFTTTDDTEEETSEEIQETILIITLLTGVCLSIGLALVFLVCVKARSSCKKADMFDAIMEEAGKIASARKAKEEEAAAEAEIGRAETEKEKPTTPTT